MSSCTFIIFGSTGDLARKKLIPACAQLIKDKKLSNFLLIGVAREQMTATTMIENALPFCKNISEETIASLKKFSSYIPLDVSEEHNFEKLAEQVTALEHLHGLSGNRLVHLAVPSTLFSSITSGLTRYGIIKKAAQKNTTDDALWHRVIYEKPFGWNEHSAQEINSTLEKLLSEDQIYRIDHYLTKELVESILLVRFTNIMLEPLWNHHYIDHVEIIMQEQEGIDGRGSYYDSYGVLKDVVQNHIMQLLALVAMDLPTNLSTEKIQEAKGKVLKNLVCIDGILGQYDGYKTEASIKLDSSTPTFAALAFNVNTPRWKTVPFFIKTGKYLKDKYTGIRIKFKDVQCTLTQACIYSPNYLSINIAPRSEFSIQLNTKKPRSTFQVVPVNFTFNHDYMFGMESPDAYELLYERVIAGDRSIVVSFNEINFCWKIIDSIENMNLPLYTYLKKSFGPKELAHHTLFQGITWHD